MISVYLAGPMSGYPEFNFPAFHQAADTLRSLGYRVFSPADFGVQPHMTWDDCMKRDLPLLWGCECLVYLPGAEESRGARLEMHVAKAFNIPCVPFRTFIKSEPATVAGWIKEHWEKHRGHQGQ